MLNRTQASRRMAALVLALSLVPISASAQTKFKAGWNLFSAEQDVQIGRDSAAQAERQLPILNDATVQSYVNRIGQKLAAQSGGPKFPYTFKVVNASDINAFALPGGPIYINRGVLDQARNEGEVAGVIAHEIAHVALRHGTHQASKAYAAQAGISILGGLLGGRVGQGAGDIINAVGGLGLNALFLKYSRDLETQADLRGAQILAAAGYTPADMIGFFNTLARVDTARKTSWLSDHPAPPDRVRRIEQEARLLNVPNQPTTNVAELRQVQSRMASTYGSARTLSQIAQGGASTTNRPSSSRSRPSSSGTSSTARIEAPSTAYSAYTNRSGVYRVHYPSNWRVYEQDSTGVIIAPDGGVASASGRTEIVYGAIINHYNPFNGNVSMFSSGRDITIEEATNDLLAQIRNDSPHLSVIRNSTQRVQTAGGPGLAAALRGTNPNTGIRERVTVVTRQLEDGHLVYLLFVSPDRDASALSPVLQNMVSSLQVDTNAGH